MGSTRSMTTLDPTASPTAHLDGAQADPAGPGDGAGGGYRAGQPATAGENLLTLLGGVWLIAGLFIDGYAHSEILETDTEDFFTPWHAIFYSGFLFVTAVIGWIWLRRAGEGTPASWLPPGYGWSVVGLAVFAVGGLGDGIWHTVFGVETGIDALLSPTHLVLFAGMALILTTPLRAFWLDPSRVGPGSASWSSAGGAVASTAIATALTGFFFVYAFGLDETWTHRVTYNPVTEANEDIVALGLASAYVGTMILVVPVLGLLRRTDLPPGAVVVIWTVPTLAVVAAFGGSMIAVPSAAVGAIVLELAMAGSGRRLSRGRAVIVAVGIGTVAMWSAWMALAHRADGVAWMPELWAGQIVMCGIVAVALGALAFPPAMPEAATGGRSRMSSGRTPIHSDGDRQQSG